MGETTTPKPGEWWISPSGKKAFIVGTKLCGTAVFEEANNWIGSTRNWEGWHHEP